uniref:Uncharacterized protein n=1 Tax=Salix viminalis TaxID=40686 RepID=A0A6N2LFF8_SALVM
MKKKDDNDEETFNGVEIVIAISVSSTSGSTNNPFDSDAIDASLGLSEGNENEAGFSLHCTQVRFYDLSFRSTFLVVSNRDFNNLDSDYERKKTMLLLLLVVYGGEESVVVDAHGGEESVVAKRRRKEEENAIVEEEKLMFLQVVFYTSDEYAMMEDDDMHADQDTKLSIGYL